MKGWPTVPLGELCQIELGGTPSRSSPRFWDEGRITDNVWLSIADLPVTLNAVVSDSKEYLSDEGAARGKVVKAGTLLVSFKLTLGRLAFAGCDLRTNEAIAALSIIETKRISKEYLYWYLTYFDWDKAAEGEEKIKGKTLNKAKLKELAVLLPSLEEQRRIVAVLDEAFAAIATATANAEKNLANSRELFIAERERILHSPVAGWSQRALSEICTIKHGFAFKSEHFCDQAEHTLLTPGNFFEAGGYRDRGAKQKYYDGPIPEGFVLSGGDLLIAMTEQAAGLLGSPILVPTSEVYLHNQRLGLVQPRLGVEWVNDFFFHVFNTAHLRDQLHQTGTGQKVRHTSPGKIGDVVVQFPATAAEQSAVANQLDDLRSQTEQLYDAYSERLEKLTHLKQSFLRRAFTGELTAAMPETLAA